MAQVSVDVTIGSVDRVTFNIDQAGVADFLAVINGEASGLRAKLSVTVEADVQPQLVNVRRRYVIASIDVPVSVHLSNPTRES